MARASGTILGSYEILAPLGSGGMGDVYRARDRKLGREVAIKVLRPGIASDTTRLKRFEQEARTASALNHPNIVTIYEIGEHDGEHYIAMELVDGNTLRELLASGPVPPRKLLDLGKQIAEGLAKAHAAGIVHRDLKPENLMLSRDGYVKILDFGLAKLWPDPSGIDSEMATSDRLETRGRRDRGDGRLHVAGAGEGSASGFPLRPVLVRGDSLRAGNRQAAVREVQHRGDSPRHPP